MKTTRQAKEKTTLPLSKEAKAKLRRLAAQQGVTLSRQVEILLEQVENPAEKK